MYINPDLLDLLTEKCLSSKINIDLQSNLKNDLGIDSLRIVELLLNIEKKFSIEFDESDLDPSNLTLVKHLDDLITKYR
jgi:acyl carrier protein